MAMVFEVLTKKYVWLEYPDFVAQIPDFFASDKKFVEKVLLAYQVQVKCNHGWGFTVQHKGFRIRFDLENTTKNKIPKIYEPCVEEKPEAVQKTLDDSFIAIKGYAKPKKSIRGVYEKGYGEKWAEGEI
jgi:hypothetical protein